MQQLARCPAACSNANGGAHSFGMTREELQRYKLPDTPGVYFFLGPPKRREGGRGPKREVLYIGKATSLHDRVRSYFNGQLAESRSPAIVAMVQQARSIDWQECESVLEALILEANLIKKHQPRFNHDEKDDKSWNYLVITKENFPRLLVVRGRELFDPTHKRDWLKNPKGSRPAGGTRLGKPLRTFGPFPHGGQFKEALKLVRKIFPYRDTCTPGQGKPCFNRQIGLCPGVCTGEVSKEEYKKTIRNIAQLFSGGLTFLRRRLEQDMKIAARLERFEEAQLLRRQVAGLTHIRDVSLIKEEHRAGSGRGAPLRQGYGGHVRIEAYDIAHTAGKETVGVMTVVQAGEVQKAEYRKFKIQGAENNDVAALAEMLERRLRHAEWQFPRVIVVDGGAAQLRRAQSILRKAEIGIPVVGVVKNEFHKPERLIGDLRAIETYEKDILLANSEAHRYGIGYHRKRLRRGSFQ